MSVKIFLLINAILLLIGSAYGQAKYEKEYRLKLENVPIKARQFVDSLQFERKVRWYYEQNLQGNSIEAKVRNNKKYSIEFDTLGNLQDIEIGMKGDEIPMATRKNICSTLDSIYDSFKINKIQVQYKGKNSTLLSLVRDQKTTDEYSTNYELIVKGRKARQVKLYEITFTQKGTLIHISEIIFRNTFNLEY